MGALPATNRVSVEEYLTNPAYARCEYVDGEPVERPMVELSHSTIQLKLGRRLDEYLDTQTVGFAGTEVHCRLTHRGAARFRVPDVALIKGRQPAKARYLDGAPDLAVEIQSPSDSVSRLMRKMDEYFANGAKLGWIVLPDEKAVIVLAPGNPPRTVLQDETLDGGELLPGLAIPLAGVFPSEEADD